MEVESATEPTLERHQTPDFATAFDTPASLDIDERAFNRLIRRHGLQALHNFSLVHAAEFARSCALVYAGDAATDAGNAARQALDNLGLRDRSVHQLADKELGAPVHYYFFLRAEDQSAVRTDPGFVLWYGRGVMPIGVARPSPKSPKSPKPSSPKRRVTDVTNQVNGATNGLESPSRAIKQPRHEHALVKRAPPQQDEEQDERALVALEDVRTLFREQQQQMTTLCQDLALSRELMQERDNRHKLELELKDAQAAQRESELRREFQARELELYKSLMDGVKVPQSLAPPLPKYKMTCLQDWISPKNPWARNLPLQLGDRQLPRHHGLYQNPQITPHVYAALARRLQFDGTRLSVPLSYVYRFRDVLAALRLSMPPSQQQQLDRVIERCPENYRIQLRACQWPQQHLAQSPQYQAALNLADSLNRVNLSVLMVHCQAVVVVHAMNEKAARASEADKDAPEKKCVKVVRLAPLHALETSPDPDLMDAYYPLAQYSGPGTYLAPYMGLRVANPTFEAPTTPVKNGGGKTCKFCWTKDRILGTTAADFQFTHQTRTCPLLANLSRNEAVILATLYRALQKTPGNEVRAADLLDKNKQEFLFTGVEGLMREATDEELRSGQHWAGLRLNERVFGKLLYDVRQLVEHQVKTSSGKSLRRPLFAALDPSLNFLLERFYPHFNPRDFKLSQLLLDGSGTRVFEVRKPTKEPGLYFSLQRQPSPQANADAQFQQYERQMQQLVVEQYQQGLLY